MKFVGNLWINENSLSWRLKRLGFLTYSEYLQSNHWKEFRADFYGNSQIVSTMLSKKGYLYCQFCHKKDEHLHLHHTHYKNLGKESFSDIRLLCKDCHSGIHIMNRERRSLESRTEIFKKKKISESAGYKDSYKYLDLQKYKKGELLPTKEYISYLLDPNPCKNAIRVKPQKG